MSSTLRCSQCGAPLTSKRRDARYCGGPCRAAASRGRAASTIATLTVLAAIREPRP